MDGGPWRDSPASRRYPHERPPLRQAALRRALLAPCGPFARLDVHPRVGSTNAALLAAAAQEPAAWPHLSVLTADHQDAGRGRRARSWTTPPRSAVVASVLLRPVVPQPCWSWLPLVAGTAVVDALRRVAGTETGLKWPNDILVLDPDGQARKVCGVLAEVLPGPGRGDDPAVVIGIGVNVSQTRAELPVPTSTSLRLAGAATTDRDTVLRAVLRSLALAFDEWQAADGEVSRGDLAARVREDCWSLGAAVHVELPGGRVLEGTAEEVDDDGRLVVRDRTGVSHAVAAGDVVHAGLRAGP